LWKACRSKNENLIRQHFSSVADILLAALSDTLDEHPELIGQRMKEKPNVNHLHEAGKNYKFH
jgi:hypothetical protein